MSARELTRDQVDALGVVELVRAVDELRTVALFGRCLARDLFEALPDSEREHYAHKVAGHLRHVDRLIQTSEEAEQDEQDGEGIILDATEAASALRALEQHVDAELNLDDIALRDRVRRFLARDPEPEPADPGMLRDLLSLVAENIPAGLPTLEVVAAWDAETVDQVERWAAAVYLRASDHDVEIPPLPFVLSDPPT